MEIKLTPRLAYVIGLWKTRRTKEGIGIFGGEGIREVFLKGVLGLKLMEARKIQMHENKIFFYHSAYRAFFEGIVKDQCERFAYRNDYAANYLAGMFDGVGGFDKERGVAYLAVGSMHDEMLLWRLGFRAKKEGKRVMIGKPEEFFEFVKPYLKYVKA